jgi:PPOX class probable FMN-dependent enzyme
MFDEVITTKEKLREIVGTPSHRMSGKGIDHIDDICRKYIAASPYIVISTCGGDGLLDMSPKGDPAGFVHVINEKTLAIPERLGNKRADTFENLLINPEVGIIFLIPGFPYILRVSGKGQIVRDRSLQEMFIIKGKQPDLIIAITVEEAFVHCAKSIARSNIWKPENWPSIEEIPPYSVSTVAHAELTESAEEMQTMIDDDFNSRMY